MPTNSEIYKNIYKKYLKDIENGIYVECGAIDGVHRSITIDLYKKGWTGFNIEPNPLTFKKLVKNRPNDINLNLGLSNINNDCVKFYIPNGKIRGFETGTGAMSVPDKMEYITENIKVITFDRFVEMYSIKKIDFMVLDVEGHELDVIERFNYSSIKPKYLLIETALIDVKKLFDLIIDDYDEINDIDVGWENKLFTLRY